MADARTHLAEPPAPAAAVPEPGSRWVLSSASRDSSCSGAQMSSVGVPPPAPSKGHHAAIPFTTGQRPHYGGQGGFL